MQDSNFSKTYDLTSTAKQFNLGRNQLTELLREKEIFQDGTMPHQQYIDRGYFIRKEKRHSWSSKFFPYTLVTYKGLVWLRREFGKT